MNDRPENPKPFHLKEGDAAGFSDDGSLALVTWPESVEPPEVELLGELESNGATFRKGTWPVMVSIVSGWKEKHCESPHDPRLAFSQREIASRILKAIIDEPDMEQAVLKAHCLAFDLKLSPCKTAKELADRLGLSEGRISQVRTALKTVLW